MPHVNFLSYASQKMRPPGELPPLEKLKTVRWEFALNVMELTHNKSFYRSELANA